MSDPREENLRGKIALVTGGGSGIGRAVCLAFAAAGCHVHALGRRREPLEETRRLGPSDRITTHECDVTDRARLGAVVESIVQSQGRLDIVVNNAGVNVANRRVSELRPEDWDTILAVNATGVFNVIRATLPYLRQSRGTVITISSIAGLRPSTLAGAAYSAAKHAATALTRVLGLEEAEHGVRACVISPGEVDTPILMKRPTPVTEEHRARILQPEDVARAALFVASLPPRATVAELVIKPTTQPFA